MELNDLFGTAPVEKKQLAECPKPGVYYNIPSYEYHSWPCISSTLLKAYAKLPSTARSPYVPGVDANIGSGIHAYSLQGIDGFNAECIIGPKGTSKAAEEERASLKILHPGKVILPESYGTADKSVPIMDVLKNVDASLRAHKKVGPMLEHAEREVSVVWIDPNTECHCKARFDIYDGSIIWDLKKTRDISKFRYQMRDLGYFIQAGFYFEGAQMVGLPAVAFGFVPCEITPPYQVECGYCDPDKLELARENAKRLVGLVKQSQLTGNWPTTPVPEHIYNLDDIQPDDLVQIYS